MAPTHGSSRRSTIAVSEEFRKFFRSASELATGSGAACQCTQHASDRLPPGGAKAGATIEEDPPDVSADQRRSAELHCQNHPGYDRFSSMDRRRVGHPVLPSQGFHAGLHHRTRLYGRVAAGVPTRSTKIIGLSVDPVENHAKWAQDIEETQGRAVNYPMIGDTELQVAMAYDMLPGARVLPPTAAPPPITPPCARSSLLVRTRRSRPC